MISYYQSSYRQTRYMANVAGVGFDAAVNRRYNHLKEEGKRGKWLYLWSTLKAIMRYNSTGVKVYVDDNWWLTTWYTVPRSVSANTTAAACCKRRTPWPTTDYST